MGGEIGTISAVVGISTLVLLALVYAYSTIRKGSQDILRQDNEDLRASNQEMRTQKAGMEATIISLQQQNRELREIATQTPQVTQLIDLIKGQQKQLGDQHVQVMTGFTNLTRELSGVAKAINNKQGR